jgi:hypothetical protein
MTKKICIAQSAWGMAKKDKERYALSAMLYAG